MFDGRWESIKRLWPRELAADDIMEWIRKNLLFRYQKGKKVEAEEKEKDKRDDGEFIDLVQEAENKEVDELVSYFQPPKDQDPAKEERKSAGHAESISLNNFDSSIFETPPVSETHASDQNPSSPPPISRAKYEKIRAIKKHIATNRNPPSQLKNNIIHQPK